MVYRGSRHARYFKFAVSHKVLPRPPVVAELHVISIAQHLLLLASSH